MCHLVLFSPIVLLPIFWFLPFGSALPLYLAMIGTSALLYFKIFAALRSEVQTGQEAMLGKEGLVIEALDPEGKIQYASEIWEAMSKGRRFSKGERIRITGFEGLKLLVDEIRGRRV